MKKARWFAIIGAALLASLLAFPLQAAVYRVVVVPISYLIWNLYLLYRVIPQFLWWMLLFVLAALMVAGSLLLPKNYSSRKKFVKLKAAQGPVETLANWMKNARSGIYFKWLIANRLGKLAHQMFARDETNHYPGPALAASPDWNLPKPVQDYLEVGLFGSFVDFPQASLPWTKSPPTPLDCDLAEIIKALEAQDIK